MSLEKSRHIPLRRCCGCGERFPKNELTRFCIGNAGLMCDREQNRPGRGAYLCGKAECAELAIKKRALNRTLKADVSDQSDIIRRCFNGSEDL